MSYLVKGRNLMESIYTKVAKMEQGKTIESVEGMGQVCLEYNYPNIM